MAPANARYTTRSRSTPIFPILTTRTRHYSRLFQHPITTRQRYQPYPTTISEPGNAAFSAEATRFSGQAIASLLSPVIPGTFSTFLARVTQEQVNRSSSVTMLNNIQNDDLEMSEVTAAVSGGVNDSPSVEQPETLRPLLENDGLIPKPVGEAGRRVSGRGYNIEEALEWPAEDLENLKMLVHTLCRQHLNCSKSYQYQNNHALLAVRDAATTAYPRLNQYVKTWPVSDIIKMHLKNTSSKGRQVKKRNP